MVGYEIILDGDVKMAGTGKGKMKEGEEDGFEGKIMYLLPGGIMSTQVMARKERVGEDAVEIQKGGVAVFE